MPSPQLSLTLPTDTPPHDMGTISAKSIKSDDPEPSQSELFSPSVPRFSLKQSFPSILKTARCMKAAGEENNVLVFYDLAQMFLTSLHSIVRSLDDLPYDVQSDPGYEVAKYAATLTAGLLKRDLETHSPPTVAKRPDLRATIELVYMAYKSLKYFLKAAEHIFAQLKPLPELPLSDTLYGPKPRHNKRTIRQYVPLSVIIEEELSQISTPRHQTITESEENSTWSSAKQPHPPRRIVQFDGPLEKPHTLSKGGLLRRILRRRAALSSGTSLETSVITSSPPTATESKDLSSSFPDPSMISIARPEQPYIPRQSLFYFVLPDIDVEMPLPQGDTVALRLDSEGRVKAASLAALVRLLTSKKGVSERGYLTSFFICFRFYVSSRDLLDELKKRFSEQPPGPLNDQQLQVWINHTIAIRIRVGRVIQMWVDLYWRPQDDEIFEELQAFVLEQLAPELPEKLMESIVEGLGAVWDVHGSATRVQDLLFAYRLSNPVPLPPTNILLGTMFERDDTPRSIPWRGSAGREKTARELTIWVSEEFRKIDVEEMIQHWEKEDDEELDIVLKRISRFERRLCVWVVHSILSFDSPEERAREMEFWVDVAARCLRLRNFSGAHAIFCGLGHSAVHRLKDSILRVELATKLQYRAVEQMFDPRSNYRGYRLALSGTEPTIPLRSVHARDVTSALKVMPRYVKLNEDQFEKKLINIRSYGILMKSIRGIECSALPYDIVKDDVFHYRIEEVFATLPDENDPKNTLHDLSIFKEARKPEFNQVDRPWDYIFTGKIQENGHREYLPLPPAPHGERLEEDPFALPAVFEQCF